jgi:bacteriocin biosynthesis cyclodehydratase domain-containing protein
MRPQLRRSVDPRLTRDGRLYLVRGPAQSDLELGGDSRLLSDLIRLADGSRGLDALAGELAPNGASRDELESTVHALAAEGVLDDATQQEAVLGSRDGARFERQLPYFADMEGSWGSGLEAQRRLGAATVCLLGLGGLGSWIAWALVSAGVGGVIGVDGDVVEESNLNRQILFEEADVGRPKAAAAGERLARYRSALRFTGIEQDLDGVEAIRRVIRGADFVVDTLDWPPRAVTRWVSEACFAEGIPYIASSQHPPLIRIGPLYVPGETGCFACQELEYEEDYPLYRTLAQSEPLCPPSATFGPACGAAGVLASNEVVAWLTGLYPPSTAGSAAILDLRTMKIEHEPVERRNECSVCGGVPAA